MLDTTFNKQSCQERDSFLEQIMQLPVLDTHTHLVGERLCARNFWEIADYFWLNRELQTGGYPAKASELPEEERINAFLEAYHGTRNTLMNIVFTQMMQELFGVEITDAASIRRADALVQSACQTPSRAQDIADRLNVKRFVVNYAEHADFQGTRERAILMPRIDGKLGGWVNELVASAHPMKRLQELALVIEELLGGYQAQGCPGVMTTLPRYESSANRRVQLAPGCSKDDALMELLHAVGAAAEKHGLLVQFFLGVERSWCGEAFPANDPARVLKLTALFETYACPFELVVASELNNLDVVQAAWNFPNVSVGGMWWFNFRASTYRDSMQYRIEAISAMKSSLVVSDARCMEWSYGKIWVIKKLLGQFLWDQLAAGWIDRDVALQVAEDWLYRSSAKRYGLLSSNRTPQSAVAIIKKHSFG
ncbi:glucuronate isomerase [Paenibacillus aestuarii]|uniref:Glucuronate isomerase n=1 Tax=Paenibacillus aestuarii TaxID=516965 RepID=A0ABW0K6J3_9BACL|nr:glucuronate isomerase [Paenibacillus aestuarii]